MLVLVLCKNGQSKEKPSKKYCIFYSYESSKLEGYEMWLSDTPTLLQFVNFFWLLFIYNSSNCAEDSIILQLYAFKNTKSEKTLSKKPKSHQGKTDCRWRRREFSVKIVFINLWLRFWKIQHAFYGDVIKSDFSSAARVLQNLKHLSLFCRVELTKQQWITSNFDWCAILVLEWQKIWVSSKKKLMRIEIFIFREWSLDKK